MSSLVKNQREILAKLGIQELNPMQQEAQSAIHSKDEVVLLSPTGTGKTLAFLLPIIQGLNPQSNQVQAMIIVPSRELAIQIEQVVRDMGSGFKTNVVYGGRSFNQDKIDLKHPPAIIIGTPGRIADHLRRKTFALDEVSVLVLDEFDKSLEVGFEGEMKEISRQLKGVKKRILTSATKEIEIPHFVGLTDFITVDYLHEGLNKLTIKAVISNTKDKLETLVKLLNHLGNQPGIIFCNFKDSIHRVSEYLSENGIEHGCFYGGLEQQERERALIKFRNGTHKIIIATDLAARGLDIPEIKFIIHYHLPVRSQEFTHRNGRTARMTRDGTAYVLKWVKEDLPDFIKTPEIEKIMPASTLTTSNWTTLFISGGRRDKISKGDIVGLFLKQGKLNKDELGIIELKQDCAFVAIKKSKRKDTLSLVNNTRLKNKKVRVYEI